MAESGLDGPNRYQFDDLTVDTGKRLVLRDTSALEISGLTKTTLEAKIAGITPAIFNFSGK